MKFDLAKMLAEIERDDRDDKKTEGAPQKKVLTQEEIKALAIARRKARKSAAK
jgi:hypothetical protein